MDGFIYSTLLQPERIGHEAAEEPGPPHISLTFEPRSTLVPLKGMSQGKFATMTGSARGVDLHAACNTNTLTTPR